ncbi:MAG: MGMT family protein [Aeromonadaceae bacterium]|nr:MGMT family protein [Aeromonadaceae bacterium]
MSSEPQAQTPMDNFTQRVYQVVAMIPEGRVATYGTIARLAGSPRAARQVGGILCRLPADTRLPWHRVVNRFGTSSLEGDGRQCQLALLAAEGIDGSAGVDLPRYGWQG